MKTASRPLVLLFVLTFPALFAATLPACKPSGSSPTAQPPPSDSSIAAACANMAKQGCQEGGPSCPPTMTQVLVQNITRIDLPCLTLAPSKAAVRACSPSIACP